MEDSDVGGIGGTLSGNALSVVTVDEAKAIFQGTAPRYQSEPGLVRKYYVLSEDGMTAGGVYLWRSRQDAEAMYTDDWRAFVTGKYGAPPQVVYKTPVMVDNPTRQILVE